MNCDFLVIRRNHPYFFNVNGSKFSYTLAQVGLIPSSEFNSGRKKNINKEEIRIIFLQRKNRKKESPFKKQ